MFFNLRGNTLPRGRHVISSYQETNMENSRWEDLLLSGHTPGIAHSGPLGESSSTAFLPSIFAAAIPA